MALACVCFFFCFQMSTKNNPRMWDTEEGWTDVDDRRRAFVSAAGLGDAECVRAMLGKEGADPGVLEYALMMATLGHHADCFRVLVSKLDMGPEEHRQALATAVLAGYAEGVRMLIDASPNAGPERWSEALSLAVNDGFVEIVRMICAIPGLGSDVLSETLAETRYKSNPECAECVPILEETYRRELAAENAAESTKNKWL